MATVLGPFAGPFFAGTWILIDRMPATRQPRYTWVRFRDFCEAGEYIEGQVILRKELVELEPVLEMKYTLQMLE